ncbi:MAG TPA: 2OG-Fe(II) oxygenase [Micropepsaceae bacterium]|mgnify:CR=1 FL=1|nr:2OG-Fe(II) oxygenase [Micropepsaceae bacterium]
MTSASPSAATNPEAIPQAVEHALDLAEAGKFAEARDALWAEIKETGHPVAHLFLADFLHRGIGGERDPLTARNLLKAAALAGSARGASLYATFAASDVDGPRNFDEAADFLVMAASLGDLASMAELAIMLTADPSQRGNRQALIEAAAMRGDGIAAWLAHQWRLESADRTVRADADVWLMYAARLGHPLAVSALRARMRPAPAQVRAPLDRFHLIPWEIIREKIVLPHTRPLPPAVVELNSPYVRSMRGLLTTEECDYLCAKGADRLEPARVGQGTLHEARTNESSTFDLMHASVLVQSLDTRIALALDAPPENGERLVLLRYLTGQAYAPHFDWLDPEASGDAAAIEAGGQRLATLITYLNADFTGGETHFVRTNAAFRGNKGDALLWSNVLPDGSVDAATEHAGRPPLSGEKYLLSKWMRDRSQAQLRP